MDEKTDVEADKPHIHYILKLMRKSKFHEHLEKTYSQV